MTIHQSPPGSSGPFTQGISRRRFLTNNAGAAGLLAGSSWLTFATLGFSQNASPSQRVTVGLIGRGAMGSGHLRRLARDPKFRLLALCEVDQTRLDAGKEVVESTYAADRQSGAYSGCSAYQDYRELLARQDIDAVVIATPDHWHALQAIDAAKSGKDVYLEKPVSITIDEGRKLVDTVQRYGRVFQTGSQYRSIPTIRQVCNFVRAGGLGKVKSVFTLLNNLSGWLGSPRFKPYSKVLSPEICGREYVPMEFALPEEPIPAGLNWDLWVGPASWHSYNQLYHVNPSPGVVPWCFCEAFGVTSSTWFLSHAADVIQYALGCENSGPVEIIHPSSGVFPTLTCRYASGTLMHFVDHWGMVKDLYHALPANARLAGNFGGVFVGERGWITSMSTGGPIEGGPEELLKEVGLPTREVNIGANDHYENWLECIASRKRPSAHEEIGHRSASLGHLTNIAFWTGQSLRWDPAKEEFSNSQMANRLRRRSMRAPWRI